MLGTVGANFAGPGNAEGRPGKRPEAPWNRPRGRSQPFLMRFVSSVTWL